MTNLFDTLEDYQKRFYWKEGDIEVYGPDGRRLDKKGMAQDAEWDESKHKRGQPENAGEFAKTGGTTSKTGTGTTSKTPAPKNANAPTGKSAAGFTKLSKVIFEVAPNPDDVQLTQRWNKIDAHTKTVISTEVLDDILPEIMHTLSDDLLTGKYKFGVKKNVQFGGFLEETNPSISIIPDKNATDAQVGLLARVLGSALSQQSVMRVSTKPFKGSDVWGAVHIKVPTDISYKQVEKLYNKLRTEVVDDEGGQLIYGHTTDKGRMVILTDAGTEEDLHNRVSQCLGDVYEVGYDTVNVSMPEAGKDDYGFNWEGKSGKGLSYTPLQQWVHSLRASTSKALGQRLKQYEDANNVGAKKNGTD